MTMPFGAFRSRADAEEKIAELHAREMNGENWARSYHDEGFVVREAIIDTDFEVPALPKPRDKWALRTTTVSSGPSSWPSTRVEVCLRDTDGLKPVASYLRNHTLYQTFEPFRQGTRELALGLASLPNCVSS